MTMPTNAERISVLEAQAKTEANNVATKMARLTRLVDEVVGSQKHQQSLIGEMLEDFHHIVETLQAQIADLTAKVNLVVLAMVNSNTPGFSKTKAKARRLKLSLEKDSGRMKAENIVAHSTMGVAKQVTMKLEQKFVEEYSRRTAPMTELLKKGQWWNWPEKCQGAFDDLKDVMMRDSVLSLPDVMKPFKVQTDASDYALGGVLL
ncbi:uncharacterized protein LOC131165998 [Malania oleifera]|uniref:uncharacterized protein LOC131165998 n=1 Tax=Malania oleifera TaxID=397392 RepID=UPI0025AE8CF2|nr:uncharacterized protein LOC131165998 [Malania oleifera]